MITKITGEQPFQVLTNNFSISPSNEGYTLQISADGKQYSNLFTVGAGVTRLVTGVAANSYYRLSGNQSEVSVNWMKTCVTEGGGGASGTELSPVSEFPAGAEAGTVIAYSGSSSASGVYQYDGNEWTEVGADIDLSAYWTSAETQSALTAVEDHLFDVEEVTASALTELHEGLLEVSAATAGKADAATNVPIIETAIFPKWNNQGIITGVTGNSAYKTPLKVNGIQKMVWGDNMQVSEFYAPVSAGTAGDILVSTGNGAPVWSAVTMGGNSNILAAISSLTEYEAISGSVKTGDLIQVYNVDINGDGDPEYGLFQAEVQEEEDGPGGDIIRIVYWERKDNADSVLWADKIYPWMADNDVWPADFAEGHFLISTDDTAEDEAYNGIGFDDKGKPVITHIVPQYEEGKFTGMTRTDANIVKSTSVSTIWKGTQTEYDTITESGITADPTTLYIII